MRWKRITSLAILLCMFMSMFTLPIVNSAVVDIAETGVPTIAERLDTPMVGIDVSSWNQEIDWAKVKAAGVEFAIVRVFHHLKNTPNYELDEYFERNVSEAQKYGIELGAYFFSYAQTLDAIEGEAEMLVNELNKYPGVFTFPIIFDAEDGDTTDDPAVEGNDVYDIGSFAGDACKNFCDILSANGYYPMVYSYTWYFENKIGMSKVKDYDLWLASYPRSGSTQIYAGTGPADAGSIDHSKRDKLSSYDSNVTMWQYTGAGKIDGIYHGDGGAIVDLNVSYVDYPSIIKNGGYNGFTKSFKTEPLIYRTGANGPAATYQNSKYYKHVTSIGLTGDGVTDTLAAALSQLGYYEGTASNPYGGLYNTYDQYTSNKTTEYVYNYGDADSSGYKMAWCASFCSWALYQSRVTDHSTHAQSCRNNIGNKTYIWRECSCYQWADQLKRFSMYSERGSYTPKTGDLIFFKMDGGGTAWTNHIGLVRYCDGSKVYTVEGNRHNHVGLYSYSLSDSQICGYGKLPYPANEEAPKVDYSGANKTAGQYITNNVTLSVSNTKGGSTAFSVGKYEMFDVTGFDGGYAKVSYNGNTGYATLNSNTIQVTATSSAYYSKGLDVAVDSVSVANTSFAAGSGIPIENNNAHNPNVLITGLREDSNRYKGLENYGTNKDKIMINGRTWDKWESREGAQILENIWIYGVGDGKAYLGIDIADTNRLRVQGTLGHGEEIKTIVIKRGFEIVKTNSNLWSNGEISADGTGVESVIGVFKENVILIANDFGGFDVVLGGSDSLGLNGYTFQEKNPQIIKVNNDVNIRSGPGSSYESIAVAYNGESYEYLDEAQGNFHKIDYKGQVAWASIYNNLTTLTDVYGYVVVTSYELNIRSGPGTTYDVLGTGSNGEKFEYLGEIQNSKWLKVKYNGQTGWISNVNASIEPADQVVHITAQNLDWTEEPIVHTFGDWVDETSATCTDGGTQKRTCSICGLEETQNTDAKGHTEEAIAGKDATCTETGLTEGKKCTACGVVIVEQTEIPAKDHMWENGICSTCGEVCEHTFVGGKCTICDKVKDTVAKLEGCSLSLGGNIAVNYYMTLSDNIVNDEEAKVVFTLPDDTKQIVYVNDAEITSEGYYAFTCEITAIQMSDDIKAQVVAFGYESEVFSYSVVEYADFLIKEAAEGNAQYVDAVPLVKSMLNYGANAQIYFEYETDNLANKILAEEDRVLTDVSLSAYRPVNIGSEAGIRHYGTSLTLKSETVINVYFVIEDEENIPDFYVNDVAVKPVKVDNLYRIRIEGIVAQNLDNEYVVTVGGLQVKYSAFSYGYSAMYTSNETLKNVIRALCAYNHAAEAYLNI